MKLLKFFLMTLALFFILILSIYLYSRYIEPNQLIVKRVTLESDRIDKSIKVVLFSDTHLGEFSQANQLDKIVTKINVENADLVLFMGDLINYTPNIDINASSVSESLKKIQASSGKYAVVGNHEIALADQYDYTDLMNQGEFEVLINDYLDIPELNIRLLGIDDAYRGQPDKKITAFASDQAYNLLMTHEPDIIDDMDLENIQLVLAGHTHGGQIAIPFLTDKILPIGGRNYLKGLYSVGAEKQTHLFVSKGIGMSQLPLRFMNLPEIVSIEIRPGS